MHYPSPSSHETVALFQIKISGDSNIVAQELRVADLALPGQKCTSDWPRVPGKWAKSMLETGAGGNGS